MSLRHVFEQYHQRVQFLLIYIREAHPRDGWWVGSGLPGRIMRLIKSRAALDVYDPKTIQERRTIAGQCEDALQYGIHTYVDEMDDAVSQAYAARPTRLYLIGIDGRVIYRGEKGLFGFKPQALKDAIERYLS